MTQDQFLEGVNDWSNHRLLLWLALEETKTGDVIEFGCGDGSTPFLHEYCKKHKRRLYSFDNNREWISKFTHMASKNHSFCFIENDWHVVKDICQNPTVILIDHAPGERRIVDVKRFADMNGIQVLHDTQPQPTAADYGWERIWNLFKYRVDLDAGKNMEMQVEEESMRHQRTWASAVSNTYDLSHWKGKIFECVKENYTIK